MVNTLTISHPMKVDLNLFIVFEAIYCEGNITKAASALNLSQPAVSHSLSKLRENFNDPLFIRKGNEMRPTSVANNVITDVREALQQLKTCVAQSRQFEPSASRKHFNISLHSALEPFYLPPVMKRLKVEAPHVHLQSSRRVKRSELENKLASGDIDLAIDTLVPVSENIHHIQLEQSKMMVVARKDHPNVKHSLDLNSYLANTHILVSSRTVGQSIEDFELGRLGLQRQIGLRCQHAFSACRVVAESDMLVTLTDKTAKMYCQALDLQAFELPVQLHGIDVHLYWHTHVNIDPANTWLRQLIMQATGKITPDYGANLL